MIDIKRPDGYDSCTNGQLVAALANVLDYVHLRSQAIIGDSHYDRELAASELADWTFTDLELVILRDIGSYVVGSPERVVVELDDRPATKSHRTVYGFLVDAVGRVKHISFGPAKGSR